MQFDVKGFYPAISKDLLMKAVNSTKSFVTQGYICIDNKRNESRLSG